MKAAFIRATGAPEVIQYDELPRPEPGPTEALIKIGAVAVNPIDTYIRSGVVPGPQQFPFIIGCDLAGIVEKIGEACSILEPGDRVWGSNQGLFGRQGTFAEYAVIDEKWLYPTPSGESDAEAAAGALVGITAHLGLFLHAQLKGGEVLFVNGGTGGVGSAVVQLAKSIGAKVIATVGSAEKKAVCESWGADLVIDYHSSDLDDQIRRYADQHGGINVWFETQREPTLERTTALMAKRGRIILMAGRNARPEFPIGPFYVKDLRIFGFAMFNATPEEQHNAAGALNMLYQSGDWQPQIGRTMALSEAAAAHRLQEGNTLHGEGTLSGKIVLVP
jgi:NADPH2:quinone reductase